jgi:hypothetical protein
MERHIIMYILDFATIVPNEKRYEDVHPDISL